MLYIKKSQLPRSGLGLFTSTEIKKNEIITEYKGDVLTWEECVERSYEEDKEGYVYYINKEYCIDAYDYPEELSRYANDASGYYRKNGLTNNSKFIFKGKRVFLTATKKINPREEIFVHYGKLYWEDFEPGGDD